MNYLQLGNIKCTVLKHLKCTVTLKPRLETSLKVIKMTPSDIVTFTLACIISIQIQLQIRRIDLGSAVKGRVTPCMTVVINTRFPVMGLHGSHVILALQTSTRCKIST